jgi:hypothetical protein
VSKLRLLPMMLGPVRWVACQALLIYCGKSMKDWQPIASAPFDGDIQVSVIEKGEVQALVVPCRWTQNGWLRA